MPHPADLAGGLRTARRPRGLRVEEARVLEAIDSGAIVSFLQDFLAIRSLDGQEDEAQEFVAAAMRRFGLEVDRWEFRAEDLRSHPRFSMEVERASGLGVVGGFGEFRGGRNLILNGHVDVVPPGDTSQWSVPPWEGTVRGGRVYGRGAADMKGGLACALFAAKALHDEGIRLRGRLLVESVIAEEDGGVGTLAACLRGYRADGGIILEPTRLRVAPAQAGALCFRITVPGLAAHASVREEGVSAIEKFAVLHEALADLERRRNRPRTDPLFAAYRTPFALNIGTVRAGDWPSTVPDRLSFEGRYGVAVGEDIRTAREQFEKAISAAARGDPWLRRHPPRVEWWGGQFEPASVSADDPIVSTTVDAARALSGRPPRVEGVPYGSDMRLLVLEGNTPTVLFGPGDVRRAHRPDEHVSIEELVMAARTVALAAMRFCGVEA